MCKNKKYFLVTLILVISIPTAHATIINGQVTGGNALAQSGVFQKLLVPLGNPFGPANSVGADTFQSPNLFGFDEDQNVTIDTALNYNMTVGGNTGSTNPGTLSTGTEVASHYIFFDPAASTRMRGYVEFDSDIIAVITSTNYLNASDILANTGVNYLNPGLRGLESADVITNITNRRIDLHFFASSPGDYIRVLTQFSPSASALAHSSVPVPSSLLLIGLGIIILTRFNNSNKKSS